MDRISSFVPRSSSWPTFFISGKAEPSLPVFSQPQPKLRVKTLLGHCLYRRVFIWTFVVIACLSITLFNPRLNERSREVFDLMSIGKGQSKSIPTFDEHAGLQVQDGEDKTEVIQNNPTDEVVVDELKEDEGELSNDNGPHWLRYAQ